MGSELHEYRLEDCMDAIIDYRGKTPTKTDSGIPLITAKIIKNGQIQEVSEFIAESDYDSWMIRGIPKEGDVVLTTEAPLGEVAQLDSRKIALAQRVITLRGKQGLLDNDYLLYLLQSNDIQNQLDGRASGSTVTGIKQSELREIILRFPFIDIQKKIAAHLKAIDQKITLNRQINQTLEQMAQTLFKSWFFDFDPVIDNALDAGNDIPDSLQERAEQRRLLRAKADFKPLPAETRALFPSEFEETELGWVPKGWQIRQIKDVVERISVGKKYSQKELKPTGLVPVLDQAKTGVIGYHENAAGVNASIDNPVITFANHTCVTRLITYDFSTIQNVLPFKFKGLDIFWTYLATQGKQQFEEYKGHWPDFEIQEIIIPNEIISSYFGRIVRPYFEKIVTNEKMNEILIAIRDSLLPKLISGELALDDLPEDVAEAAEAL